MILVIAWPQVLDFFGMPVVIEPAPAQLSGEAGRIVVRLSSSWPHLDWYRRVCERLRAPLPIPIAHPSG
jgi:hypothetical protein